MSDSTPKADPAAGRVTETKLGRLQARVTNTYDALPKAAKTLLAATASVALLVIVYFAVAPMLRDYAVLYSELDGEDAATVVAKLKERQVPYRLRGDGTTIEVPEDEVRELRLSLAAAGLPRGGQLGFESFQNMRLGATEFEQQVTYRTAMEGELARTIASVDDVQSARVHLVMPKESVFSSRNAPARASVVVRLKSGRALSQQQIHGIVYLVSQAVPTLETEQVALVTTEGKTLHRPQHPGAEGADTTLTADGEPLSRDRAYESLLQARTRSMLERVLGAGHVEVRVQADLDRAKVERKSDSYDPKTTALRSEQLLIEQGQSGQLPADTVAGVPGAESNLPTGEDQAGAPPDAAPGAAGAVRRSHTRNWEVDHVQERRVSVTHTVKRLAVAVVVDGVPGDEAGAVKPRSQAELDKLALLVKSAVGFDEERGDQLDIESVPFYEEPEGEGNATPEVLPIPPRYRRWLPLARRVGIGLAVLVTLLWLRRKWKKHTRRQRRRTIARIGEPLSPEAIAAGADARAAQIVDYRVEAIERAKIDPPTAALVIRRWLGTNAHADARDQAA